MTPFSCKPAQHRSVHVLSKYSRDSFFLSSLCCVQCYPVVPLTCPHSRPHSRPHFRLYSKLYSRLYSRPHSRLYICMAVAGQGWRMLHKRMLHKKILHWLEEVTLHITLHILHCILPGVIDSCLIHVVLTSFRACDDASLDLLPCPYDLVCPCTQRVRLLCVLVCSLVCTCVLKCVYSCVYSCVLALTCVYSCAHMCIVCTRVLTFQILVSCFGSFRQLGHCEQQL